MIKKTLYLNCTARLHVKHGQIRLISENKPDKTIPIEDVGFMVIDNREILLSHRLLSHLLENNVAVITTDARHMPAGWFMPLAANSEQSGSFQTQMTLSLPSKKRLWQQTVKAKIKNQADILDTIGIKHHCLHSLVRDVASNDATNKEAVAARAYWPHLFKGIQFTRQRFGKPPNNLLNFGYAILRSVIARALCGTGLLPMLGIHHCNRYNPLPLADDIMEPYRPFVDIIVWKMVNTYDNIEELTTQLKKPLLNIPASGVLMKGESKPLHLAAGRTAASLKRCMNDSKEKIIYPNILV